MANSDDGTPTGPDEPLSADDRLELERLRAEVAALRSAERRARAFPAATGPRGHGARGPAVAGVLVGVLVGVPVGVLAAARISRSEAWAVWTDWR
ncbi:MAG TPA: hypothetical protein VIW24_01055 [Aldersonia sp.]